MTDKMKRMFDSFGYPSSIRFNGGPHFSKEFRQMLKEYNIPETPSSAYNPASNGLAEKVVGIVKTKLKKMDCPATPMKYMLFITVLYKTS